MQFILDAYACVLHAASVSDMMPDDQLS